MNLEEICNFLKNQNFNLSKQSRDGRINSAFNEDEIFNQIVQNFDNIIYPQKRDWYDFAFKDNDIFYPVNIKITNLQTDNLNCQI